MFPVYSWLHTAVTVRSSHFIYILVWCSWFWRFIWHQNTAERFITHWDWRLDWVVFSPCRAEVGLAQSHFSKQVLYITAKSSSDDQHIKSGPTNMFNITISNRYLEPISICSKNKNLTVWNSQSRCTIGNTILLYSCIFPLHYIYLFIHYIHWFWLIIQNIIGFICSYYSDYFILH